MDERYTYDTAYGVQGDSELKKLVPALSMAFRIKRITIRHGHRIDNIHLYYTPIDTQLHGFDCESCDGENGGGEESIDFGPNEYVSEVFFYHLNESRGLCGLAIRKNQDQPKCFGITDGTDSRLPRGWTVEGYKHTYTPNDESKPFIGFYGYTGIAERTRVFTRLGVVVRNQIRISSTIILKSGEKTKVAICKPGKQDIFIDTPIGDTSVSILNVSDLFDSKSYYKSNNKEPGSSIIIPKGLQYFIVQRSSSEPVCGTGDFAILQTKETLDDAVSAVLGSYVEENAYYMHDDWIRLNKIAIVTLKIDTADDESKPHVFITYRDVGNKHNKVTVNLVSGQNTSEKFLYGAFENEKLYLRCSKEHSGEASFYVKFYCSHPFQMSTDSLWQDLDFQPIEQHVHDVKKTLKKPYKWLRPDKYAASVLSEVAPHDSFDYSIRQGDVGDCYLIEAFYELLEQETYWTEQQKSMHENWREVHKRIIDIVKFDNERPGRATATMKLQGVERDIEIDDLIPCYTASNIPAFAHLVNIGHKSRGWEYQWVALLEKAFAKIAGSYFWLEGSFETEIRDRRGRIKPFYSLLGALPCPTVFLNNREEPAEVARNQNTDASWQRLVTMFKPDGIRTYGGMAATIGSDGWEKAIYSVGLVPCHAYSVVQVFELGNSRIVQLRNPHGMSYWHGAWSDNDKLNWTEQNIREYENEFHFVAKKATITTRTHAFRTRTGKEVAPEVNDGVFFMSMQDFATYFAYVTPHRLMSPENNHNWRMNERKTNQRETRITIAAQESTELELVIFMDSDPKAKFVPIDEKEFKLSATAISSSTGSNWQKPSEVSFKFWGGMLRSELMTWHNESHTITIKNPEASPYTLEVHWRHHKDKHGLDVGRFNLE